MGLFDAVYKNDIVKIMKLLEEGGDPNQLDSDKHYNILHYAVHSNSLGAVLLLITAGADLHSLTPEDNSTVFDIARDHKNEEMMSLLLKLHYFKTEKKQVH